MSRERSVRVGGGGVAGVMPLNPGVSAEDEFQTFLPIRRAENLAAAQL